MSCEEDIVTCEKNEKITFVEEISTTTVVEQVIETIVLQEGPRGPKGDKGDKGDDGVPGTSIHNDLSGLQGGTSGEYYHLTAAQYSIVNNFNESVDDRVNSLLQAGTGISLSYNDTLNTLTISSTVTGSVTSVNGQVGIVVLSTSDISEGSNLYYTNERVDDRVAALIQDGTGLAWTYSDVGNTLTGNVSLSPFSTSNLTEGSNLYYTDERVDDRVAVLIQNGTGISWSYSDILNTFTPTISLSPFSTSNLSEGSNLYYTDERVDDRVAALIQNGTGITWTYNDSLNTLTGNVSGFSTLAFSTIVAPNGSDVVADSTADTWTITHTQNTCVITNTALTDTTNFHVPGALIHPTTGSTYEYAQKPPSITGIANTFIGVSAGDSVTSGSNLNGFGNNVLTAATTASQCYGFGTTLETVTTGSKIIGIGDVIHAAIGAQFVLAIGVDVLDTVLNATGGNIGVGFNILQNIVAGGRNAALGKDIGNGTDLSGFAAIGSDIFNGAASVGDTTAVGGAIGSSGVISSTCTIIGNNLVVGGGDSLNGSTIIGSVIANGGMNNISGSILIGKSLITQTSTITNSFIFGSNIFSSAGNTASNDIVIGATIFNGETYTGNSNLIIGRDIATGSPAGGYAFSNGIIFGFSSAGLVHDATNFVIIGPNTAVAYNTGSGFVAIAESAGNGVIDGSRAIAIGQQTIGSANTILEVVAIGYACLQGAFSCDFTTAVGSYVFAAGTLYEECAAVGYKICETAPATNATHIFALGANSGTTIDTNDNVIMLGNGVEPTSGSSTNEMIVGSSGSPIDSYLWGQVSSVVAGKGFSVKEGSNAKMGVATLVGGTVVVSTTAVTATSRIFLTINTPGGTISSVYVSARTAGTSFTISSLNILDTSTVAWIIFEPS